MRFEWDATKSIANKEKHGIDFETAKELRLDEHRIEIDASHPVEKRSIIIAELHGKLWTAVYIMRSDSIRIISVRRSRRKEVKLYGKEEIG